MLSTSCQYQDTDRIQLFTQQNYRMEIQDGEHEKPVSVPRLYISHNPTQINPIIPAHYRFASSPRAGHPSTGKPDGNEPEKKTLLPSLPCSAILANPPRSNRPAAPHRQSRRLQEQLASDSHREQRQALTVSASLRPRQQGGTKKLQGGTESCVSTGTVSWFRSLWPVGWSKCGGQGCISVGQGLF